MAVASPSRNAIGVLTFTSAVPSGISSLPTLPASTASTSMVALSVSTSADDVAGPHLLAFLDPPFGELALVHGG